MSKYSDKYGLDSAIVGVYVFTIGDNICLEKMIFTLPRVTRMHLESDHAMMCKYRDIDIGLLNTLTMADSTQLRVRILSTQNSRLTRQMNEKFNDVRHIF